MEVEVDGHVNNEKEKKKEGGREKWIHVKTTSYSWCTYRTRKKNRPSASRALTVTLVHVCVCV